jgi:[glutamine synthetase] adenylyltransferase / [glutamine synthetase]-adenylyl-L-tyrosine phosphorylase
MKDVRALADGIARADADDARRRFQEHLKERGLVATDDAVDLAALLSAAYPALAREVDARPEDVVAIARGGTRTARDARYYRRAALAMIGDLSDEQGVRHGLRRFAVREKMRVAAREVLPLAGSDVDTTSRELSDLADVCVELALAHALGWAEARWGVPVALTGERCPFVVVGMGKLGGRELNAGSDIDLLLFYETDDGEVRKDGAPADQTLHEHFARVAQRMTAVLDDATEDGIVWRVDLRLRPEGTSGPLVNALAAAERYYETWGRTWERAALVRARPIAGDIAFGGRLLAALGPFVWRRNVNPQIADEMMSLVLRARAEMDHDPERDLKLGPGGIREAEFFVQSLQLIWGGREKELRRTNTLDALRRLRARGLVTDKESREVGDAYLALRRLEHRVQFATGLQTHQIPADPGLTERIARSLGWSGAAELERELDKTRKRVARRFGSLLGPARDGSHPATKLDRFWAAVDARDEAQVRAQLPGGMGLLASPDLARHILALARRPDFPLGASARDAHGDLAPVLLEGIAEAADPEQAARLLSTFFARLPTPSVYVRALSEDHHAARRLCTVLGASAFVGEALVSRPELFDRLLFGRGAPDAESATRAVDEEVQQLAPDADVDDVVGALRRAKGRVTMEVGLADLAGEIGTRPVTMTLSALADATVEHAVRFAMKEHGFGETGLAVIAMGKLGGREIGYGSDLDVFFAYEATDDDDVQARYVRTAQRVIRLLSTPHGDGPGYDLDTRLRPSGNQGLLVVSCDAFARYHESAAQDWERQALVKARFCGGDAALGARVIDVAMHAAYERGAAPPETIHHLRMRMEKELAGERTTPGRARYDLKLGHGGLVDVEFAAQWLQMKYGKDPRVRTPDTEAALDALEACGYLDASLATALRDGYQTLRRMEQRLRVLHGKSSHFIEEGAPGLVLLARRMGMRDGPRGSATEMLLARYLQITKDVRAAYLAVVGLPGS